MAKENVTIMWDTVVEEITGTPAKPPMPASASGVRVKNVHTGAVSDLAVDGIFVAIGHAPAVELFEGKLKQKFESLGLSLYALCLPDPTARDARPFAAAGTVCLWFAVYFSCQSLAHKLRARAKAH